MPLVLKALPAREGSFIKKAGAAGYLGRRSRPEQVAHRGTTPSPLAGIRSPPGSEGCHRERILLVLIWTLPELPLLCRTALADRELV